MRELSYVIFFVHAIFRFLSWSRIWIPLAWFLGGLLLYQQVICAETTAAMEDHPAFLIAYLTGLALCIIWMVWTWIRAIVRNVLDDPFWTARDALRKTKEKRDEKFSRREDERD